MDMNLVLGICLMACAVADTAVVKFVLPNMFRKNPITDEQQLKARKLVLTYLNLFTYVIFIAGLAIIYFKPLGQ
jgi:hypothetical protein